MTTADDVLDAARSQLGVHEEPMGSNHTKYGKWYGLQDMWCAMFVSWCFAKEDLPLTASTSKGFASTVAGADWFAKHNRWTTKPAKGYVVFFKFPASGPRGKARVNHVGIVEKLNADGSIGTIEGNSGNSDKVMRRTRKAYIVGYGMPGYSNSAVHAASDHAFPGTVLKEGAKGPDVKTLQVRLTRLRAGNLLADGEFGPMTAAAVKAFQKKEHLDVDGEVGPITWKTLWA